MKPPTIGQSVARSPIFWGAMASFGFYSLVRSGAIAGGYVDTYFASHPVEYAATTMFLIALAALLLKGFDIWAQRGALHKPLLGPRDRNRDLEDCSTMLRRLAQLPARRQGDYFVRRVREAVEHVQRRGSAETLDEHVKYLADLDAGRAHGSYALVRVIIWAIPILGFLGTVIGITLAIGQLAPNAVEDSLPQVVDGLGVAFATTTQALLLSIVLMFAQYYAERRENALLDEVDSRVDKELDGRFEPIAAGPDGQVVAVRRMAESVLQATERTVERQAKLWQASMDAAAARWATMSDTSGKHLQVSLTKALGESLDLHARRLAAGEQAAGEQTRRHWEHLQQAQTQGVQAIASLQGTLAKQANLLGRAVEASGEVTRLEDALNRNLAALAGAKNFEQTVMSLAAAIHLLNARLNDVPTPSTPVKLDRDDRNTQAA